MHKEFALSKSNKVFLGAVALSTGAAFLLAPDKGSEQIAIFAGRLVGFLFFPGVAAWLAWRVSGKRKWAGSWAFNIILALAAIGQLAQAGNRANQAREVAKLKEAEAVFRQRLDDSGDEVDPNAYVEYADSVRQSFGRLSKSSTGT